MAETTSVGKMQLDLEIKGTDVVKQIEKASSNISKELEKSLEKLDLSTIIKSFNDTMSKINSQMTKYLKEMQDMFAKAKFTIKPEIDQRATESVVNPNARANAPPARVINTEYLQTQADNLAQQMDDLGLKADRAHQKVRQLKDEIAMLSKPTGNEIQDFINQDALQPLLESLQKAQIEENKVGAQIDKLNAKYQSLMDKIENASRAVGVPKIQTSGIESVKNTIDKTTNSAKNASKEVSNIANNISSSTPSNAPITFMERLKESARGARNQIQGIGGNNQLPKISRDTDKASDSFRKLGSSAKSAGSQSVWSIQSISRAISSSLRSFFILRVVSQLMMAFTQAMHKCFMMSNQFRGALGNLRLAFYQAFYPIYQAVLPALITLINVIAKVISWLGALISMLFGKTVRATQVGGAALMEAVDYYDNISDAANNAGSGAKKAADDTEDAAEKIKGALAGFDQINILSIPNDDMKKIKVPNEDSNLDGLGKLGKNKNPNDPRAIIPDYSHLTQGEPAWVKRLKELFNILFEPLKKAWARDGETFLKSFRDAFQATKDILNDFYKVLQDSRVQKFMENMWSMAILLGSVALRIYADFVAPLIRWFIQSIPEACEALNPFIEGVNERLRRLAQPGFGREALDNIINALNDLKLALLPFMYNVGQGLLWFYDNVLEPLAVYVVNNLIPLFLHLLAAGFRLIDSAGQALKPLWQWFWDNFFVPLAKWTGGIILNVLAILIDLLNGISTWINNNQNTFQVMVTIILSFAAAWVVVNGTLLLVKGAITLVQGAMAILGGVITFITSPLGLITIAIGVVIAAFLLWKTKSEFVGLHLQKIWENIKYNFELLALGIQLMITAIIDGFKEMLNWLYQKFLSGLYAIVSPVNDLYKEITGKPIEALEKLKTASSGKLFETGENFNKLNEKIKNLGSDHEIVISNIDKQLGLLKKSAEENGKGAAEGLGFLPPEMQKLVESVKLGSETSKSELEKLNQAAQTNSSQAGTSITTNMGDAFKQVSAGFDTSKINQDFNSISNSASTSTASAKNSVDINIQQGIAEKLRQGIPIEKVLQDFNALDVNSTLSTANMANNVGANLMSLDSTTSNVGSKMLTNMDTSFAGINKSADTELGKISGTSDKKLGEAEAAMVLKNTAINFMMSVAWFAIWGLVEKAVSNFVKNLDKHLDEINKKLNIMVNEANKNLKSMQWDVVSEASVKFSKNVGGAMKSAQGYIRDMVVNAVGSLRELQNAFSNVRLDIRGAVNGAINQANWAMQAIGNAYIAYAGGSYQPFATSQIPYLAGGGQIDQPTLAMIGEGKYKETVVPLDRDSEAQKNIADMISSNINRNGNGGNGGTITIVVENQDGKVLAKEVIKEIKNQKIITGKDPLMV